MNPDAIRAAHALIAPHIRATPLLEAASPVAGAPPISLKLELLQHSGSFKARGAFHNLISRATPPAGCATASGGNHGAAVAYAAAALGLHATVFVPESSPAAKVAKIRAANADIRIEGALYDDAQALCDAYVAKSGAMAIHPFNSEATIAGQGTVGLEWERELEARGSAPLDTVLVAVGGGGLISGVAAWFDNRVRVIAVEPEGSQCFYAARKAGAPVSVSVKSIAADSLGSKRVGALPFGIGQEKVADAVLVSDESIREAQRRLWREFCIAAEPGGAAAYAALFSGAYSAAPGESIGVLLCGGNVNLADAAQWA
jgi:threonine dehydratase